MANSYCKSSTVLRLQPDQVEAAEEIVASMSTVDEDDPSLIAYLPYIKVENSSVYVYDMESFNAEAAARVFQALVDTLAIDEPVEIEWAMTCDKPRPGEFGGGKCVVRRGQPVEWCRWAPRDEVGQSEARVYRITNTDDDMESFATLGSDYGTAAVNALNHLGWRISTSPSDNLLESILGLNPGIDRREAVRAAVNQLNYAKMTPDELVDTINSWMTLLDADRPTVDNRGNDAGTFTVCGSHGALTICTKTGIVLSYEPYGESGEYETIKKISVTEWEEYYKQPIQSGCSIDILDVGYWLKDGTYEGPEIDWREEFGDPRWVKK